MSDDDPGHEADDLPHPPAYPVACPHCSAASGYPYRVETSRESHDLVSVSVQCKECRHVWMLQRLSGPPAPD